jgi:hypothetical protein
MTRAAPTGSFVHVFLSTSLLKDTAHLDADTVIDSAQPMSICWYSIVPRGHPRAV